MEQYVGEIRMFAGNFAPVGWEFCNGQLLSISQNEILFTLIGTTYGGDGQTTFALPDLRGRVMVHQGQNPATGTTYQIGANGGTETVTLTTNQIPSHTHLANASNTAGNAYSPNNAIWAKSNNEQYGSVVSGTMNPGLISGAGGNQPHENMMEFLTVSYIISTQGIYPERV